MPGNKRMVDSPIPKSSIMNPEGMNPDLESIIKQTKHCIQFSFFTGKHSYYLKQTQVIRLGSDFKKPTLCPTMPASRGY